jgi:Na+/H+-translocating membrane pyrophosphatase
MDLVWICVIAGLVGAGVVAYFVRYVLRQDQGSEKIRKISSAIKAGEYLWLFYLALYVLWALAMPA